MPWMVTIDPEKCKGDGLCVEICPVQLFELQENSDTKKAAVVRPDDCTGCTSCLTVCENNAIVLTEI
jgi:NAD-dependent dihydropyrimidine dehydrogenase PreA subunit